MTIRIETPDAVRWIARTLEDQGFETWAVGGAVRDAILGRPSQDWDLATRATPRQMQKTFRRTVPVGIDHGTVGVLDRDGVMYEVTTFRKDVETDGRHAVVAFADRIEDDLARRDFTINAIAWHPLREELFDPFHGAADLDERVVRTVGRPEERFGEDYLRILRAMRFAGRLDFQIHPDTWTALASSVEQLRGLSVERIHEEIWKILTGAAPPSRSLGLYVASGALQVIAPEIFDRDEADDDEAAAVSVPSGGEQTGEQTGEQAGESIAEALRTADRLPGSRPLLRWVALCRGGGASASPEAVSGLKAASDRDARAAVALVGLMTRLRFSKVRIGRAAALTAAGDVVPAATADGEVRRRFLARVGPEHLADLIRLAAARLTVRDGSDAVAGQRAQLAEAALALRAVLASGAPLAVGDLAFSGRDLISAGHRPGPWFGDLLEHLLDCVLADPSLNQADTLGRLADEWIAARDP